MMVHVDLASLIILSPILIVFINDNICSLFYSTDHHITGLVSTTLGYYDGFINLTYTHGDDYHTTPPIARTSQISFLCDPQAGKGEPEYLIESNHTYSFLWETSYACPQAPIECVVTDADGHQYDLTR